MLILLDIDGVMAPVSSWKQGEILNDGFLNFSTLAIKCLNEIILETGATIVLTTSHKTTYNLTEWVEIFKLRGINTAIDKLDVNINFLSRKEEILNWLDKNQNIGNFVILDDDKSLNGLPSQIKEKLVQTSSMIGLNEEAANLAIKILRKPNL